jgi:glucosamine-6-phosphate deaminase
MKLVVSADKRAAGHAAAARAREALLAAQAASGVARLVAATGVSQLEMLERLTAAGSGIDWTRVELFHLDEYVGLSAAHPASFQRYIRERLVEPAGITRAHLLDGARPAAEVCARVGEAIRRAPVDLVLLGIGENGHLAFNDPPADFTTEEAFIVVRLDEACRRQQVGEGWFPRLEDVPTSAITMTVRQILAARELVCLAPEARKATAVRAALEGPVTPDLPASALRTHARATLFLDEASAARLSPETRALATP